MKDKQMKELLQDMVIVIDTREKSNKHITDIFDKVGVKYEVKKVDSGDYTAYIPNTKYKSTLSIERKNSLDEISQNLTKNKARFEREFERTNNKIIIAIENNTYLDLISR